MSPIVVLVILLFVSLLGIIICSVILGIINTVNDNLNSSNYKNKSDTTCGNNKTLINNALESISTLRVINGILLALFILLFIIIIVALFIFNRSKSKAKFDANTANWLLKITLNKPFFFIVMGLLFFIFLGYTIAYGIMFSNLNTVNKTCFSGSIDTEGTEANYFNNALNGAKYQFIGCLIMLIVTTIAIGISIFIVVRSKRSKFDKFEVSQKQLDEGLQEFKTGLIEGGENVRDNLGGFGKKITGLFSKKEVPRIDIEPTSELLAIGPPRT